MDGDVLSEANRIGDGHSGTFLSYLFASNAMQGRKFGTSMPIRADETLAETFRRSSLERRTGCLVQRLKLVRWRSEGYGKRFLARNSDA